MTRSHFGSMPEQCRFYVSSSLPRGDKAETISDHPVTKSGWRDAIQQARGYPASYVTIHLYCGDYQQFLLATCTGHRRASTFTFDRTPERKAVCIARWKRR
jgi:hypothetical protein